MSFSSIFIKTPIGRLVSGSVHTGTDRDKFNGGEQYIFKSGVMQGKPKFKQWFSLAVKKENEKTWRETSWGKTIFALAKEEYPKLVESPLFSWKITDGDSEIPNSNGVSPIEKEGFAGHWILNFTNWNSQADSTFKIYMRDGKTELGPELKVNPGDYIQVYAAVSTNNSTQKPGIFISQKAISYCGIGERIIFDTFNASEVFGKDALPEGAKEIPTGFDDVIAL